MFQRPTFKDSRRTAGSIKAFALLLALIAIAAPAQAARVAAPKLLPKDTYLYLQVANVPELVNTFQRTNMGRMIADPQIRPFFEKLYLSASQAMQQLNEQIGFSVEELAGIPKGEIALAAMPVEGNQVAMVLLVDCGDQETAKKLIDTMYRLSDEAGRTPQNETVDGVVLHVNRQNGPFQPVYFEHDSTVVVTSGTDTAKQMLRQWNEGAKDSLADNARFQAIMSRCRGTKDEAPQIVFFADPLEWLWDASRFNPGMQIALRLLPALGLDGFKALGGSMVLATEDFDSILHFHLLLDNPRAGLLQVLALDSGDDTPPRWVPDDVNQYSSWHADFKEAITKATEISDSFRSLEKGTTISRLNDRAKDFLGIDLTNDLLPAITGRIVHITRFVQPPRVGAGPAHFVAIELKDSKSFDNDYERIIDRFIDRFEKRPYAGVNYYQQKGDRDPEDNRPLFCFGKVDEWLIIASQPWFMDYILNQRDESSNRLASALDFKLIASKIARQPGGDRPAMMSYEQTEAGFKYLYDLASAERTKEQLNSAATNSRFFQTLNEGLKDNPMPPWSAISKYLAPQGGMIVNDESGVHYMQFSLRRK